MKQHFFLKLNPPRPTFMMDITAEENAIMQEHIMYWAHLSNKGKVIVYGPVMDLKGVYGVGIVEADNEEELKDIISKDPANGLNQYEYYPMKAVFKYMI
jgi:uncharacterized protein YciI